MKKKCYKDLNDQDFKNLYEKHIGHCRRIRAIENCSLVKKDEFEHMNYVKLIKECLKNEFIEKESIEYLEYILDRYKIDFRVWAYRSPYVKRQIMDSDLQKQKRQESRQINMNFNVPLEILAQTQTTPIKRWSV